MNKSGEMDTSVNRQTCANIFYGQTYALFYGSKMILDHPNHFGRVPIVLDRSNMFLSGQNHFGQVQIIKNLI